MTFYHIKTSPTPATMYKWKTPEQALASISKRNAKRRIINGTMFIRMSNAQVHDPILAWDCDGLRPVYISKQEWSQGSPCITRIEACVLMRTPPAAFQANASCLGIVGRKGTINRMELSKRHPHVYYSVDDMCDILNYHRTKNNATPDEIRNLLGRGFLTYKKVGNEFIPVWT